MKKHPFGFTFCVRLGLVAALAISFSGTTLGQEVGFWHGVASNDWNQPPAIFGNWYDDVPPNGSPIPRPISVAGFFPGALRKAVSVNDPTIIGSMQFVEAVENYTFSLFSSLEVRTGITNNSPTTRPLFLIGNNGALIFRDATIQSFAAGPQIQNASGGTVRFLGGCSVGSSSIFNSGRRSRVIFTNTTNGQSVLINNSKKGTVAFLRNSNPAVADITNKSNAVIDLRKTRGPSGDHRINALQITNSARLLLGINRFVLTTFLQKRRGSLEVNCKRDTVGYVDAIDARIGGTLVVDGRRLRRRNQTQVLVTASDSLRGRFGDVTFQNFPANVEPSIEYRDNQVLLAIRRRD